MRLMSKNLAMLLLLIVIQGCANTHYTWHGYDTHLYSYYRDPSNKEEFVMELKTTIDEAEESKRVPPGLYAEYGFLLYEQGNSLQAIQYYQKEHEMWPESRFFMTKMISAAQKRIKNQSSQETLNVPTADPKLANNAQSEAKK